MFIREYVINNKKTGTRYVTHRLVETFQTDKGPRQRIIMHLGTLTLPKSEWRKLAALLASRLAGQISFLEEDFSAIADAANKAFDHYRFVQSQRKEHAVKESNKQIVPIDMASISTGFSRSLGPELVADSTWRRLDFDGVLTECGFNQKQICLAKSIIVGRLIYPGSDYRTWQWLQKKTALLEMLPVDLASTGKDLFYEIADEIYRKKPKLERALRDRETTLFSFRTTLLLYDLTNTYFEGSCKSNDLARRGKSKEKRSDCPLVTLALVVDQLGFPVFSQIYNGKQSEPKTLIEILDEVYRDGEDIFKNNLPTIVMDRGIATEANLGIIKAKSYPYIVIERRETEKDFTEEFKSIKETFECIETSEHNGHTAPATQKGDTKSNFSVYVKTVPFEDGCRVLCYSEGREQKELAIHTLKEKRFLEDFAKLQKSVAKGNIRMREKIAHRIGRINERHGSASRHYDTIMKLDDTGNKVVTLKAIRKADEPKQISLHGCYVIETSHKDLSAKEIWQYYMTLTRVENAFRSLKSELGIRPVFHQSAERTKAHLFISVLAYHLLISIEHELRIHGNNRSWLTIREQLSTHQRSTVILTDNVNNIHHVRVSGMPEPDHQEIYTLLKVKDTLPKRHRLASSRS